MTIGLMLRSDKLGVTSIIRDLALSPGCYDSMLHFFFVLLKPEIPTLLEGEQEAKRIVKNVTEERGNRISCVWSLRISGK